MAKRPLWLWLTAAWDGTAIILLVCSVFLACHGVESMVNTVADEDRNGKALSLSIVFLGHLWSSVQSIFMLLGNLGRQRRVFFGGIFTTSILSMVGCLATLWEDDYQVSLAVSVH